MRLFVALPISADVRERLAAFLGELRRADGKPRWVDPENLHVTLKFIGHVGDERLPDIARALRKVASPAPMGLQFRGIGFFPNERRPAVVWAGVEGGPDLAALALAVEQALAPCGVPREERPFAPHVTLARLREPRLAELLRGLIASSKNRVFGSQNCVEFQLLESKTKSAGPEYTTLHSFPFAAEEKPL